MALRATISRFTIVGMHRVALLCLVLMGCGTIGDCRAPVQRLVDEAVAVPLANQRFAGVVLVVRDGRPLLRKAYGMDHTPETAFMVMSVSKQFTAALIARLAASGKLRLDDRVSAYLEHWPAEWNDVEVRHL